jgi:nitrite reductase/ring-hydroxylating ferredoxin subunit
VKAVFAVLAAAVLLGGTYLVRSSCPHVRNAGIALAGAGKSSPDAAAEGASACDPGACAPRTKPAAATQQTRAPRGSVRGAYDPIMAGCQFSSCATRIAVQERDLHAQPNVRNGQLVRCPVSGAVFEADEQRPRVHLATGEYVTCCNSCAGKLRKDPSRFVVL